jgi:hypothetical protein
MTDINWDELRKLPIPTTLRLACGTDVPHAIGTRVYNYYDGEVGEIVGLATHVQPDTSGLLPDKAAWWVDFRPDSAKRSGYTTSLDGSRMCSIEHATKRGWL